jgi:hypothetical protein
MHEDTEKCKTNKAMATSVALGPSCRYIYRRKTGKVLRARQTKGQERDSNECEESISTSTWDKHACG